MTAARRLRGVDMLEAAARQAPPAITTIILNGLPRTGLSIQEFAKVSGYPVWRIRTAVRNGGLRADRSGQSAVIPVTELAVVDAWADRADGSG